MRSTLNEQVSGMDLEGRAPKDKDSLILYNLNDVINNQKLTVSQDDYKFRSEILDGVYAESKDGGGDKFTIDIGPDKDKVTRRVACIPGEIRNYLRLGFAFPTKGLSIGALIHVSYIVRVVGTNTVGTDPVRTRFMRANAKRGSKRQVLGKKITHSVGKDWVESHLLIQLVKPFTEGELLTLNFDIRAGSMVEMVEIAGLRAEYVGHLPLVEVAESDDLALLAGPLTPIGADGVAPPPLLDARGLVLSADSSGLRGVVWGEGDVEEAAHLELTIDGALRSVLFAAPLVAEGGLPGEFAQALPDDLYDGVPHIIEVRSAKDGLPLRGSPISRTLQSVQEGSFHVGKSGDLSGWAIDSRIMPQHVTVEILANGEVVATTLANQKHPILNGPAYHEGYCAFSVPIPLKLRDGRFHRLSARMRNGSALSGEVLFRLLQARFHVDLQQAGRGRLVGSIWDMRDPAKPLTLDVWVDGLRFGRVRADRMHAATGGARIGFVTPLPPMARSVDLRLEDGQSIGIFDVEPSGVPSPRPVDTSEGEAGDRGAPSADVIDLARRLFDSDWYLAAFPQAKTELASDAKDASFRHWLDHGEKRGWSPNRWFDVASYCRSCGEDAARARGTNSFLHWLGVGAAQGRMPRAGFDAALLERASQGSASDFVEAIEAWQSNIGREQSATEASGRAADGDDLKKIFVSRSAKGRIYDIHISRLIQDLELKDLAAAGELARQFRENESELIDGILKRPIDQKPLVSVITPTFNRGFLISEAIESVLDQSWSNWELIICDDGSTDKTSIIVKEFRDPRIRYFQLQKSNGAVARNIGMNFCRGDYIAFLDSDNIWHPLFLDRMLRELLVSGMLAVYSGYIDTQSQGARYIEAMIKVSPFNYHALLRKNYIDLNTLVCHRALYRHAGGFDESLSRVQDWDLMLKYGRLVDFKMVAAFAAFYRRNPAWGQVTDLQSTTNFNEIVAAKAMQAVESPIATVKTDFAPPNITILCDPPGRDARTLMVLADLLSDFARVRLVLPDRPDCREVVAYAPYLSGVSIAWTPSDEVLDRPFLAGEMLILAEQARNPLAAQIFPVFRLGFLAEQATLRRDDQPTFEPHLIGALTTVPDGIAVEKADATTTSRYEVVLAANADRGVWMPMLMARSQSGSSCLFLTVQDGRRLMATLVEGGVARLVEWSEEKILHAVTRADAVALTTRTDRWFETAVGTAGLAGGASILAVEGPTYEEWHKHKISHFNRSASVQTTIARLDEIAVDPKEAARRSRAARIRYRLTAQRSLLQDRLKLLVSISMG